MSTVDWPFCQLCNVGADPPPKTSQLTLRSTWRRILAGAFAITASLVIVRGIREAREDSPAVPRNLRGSGEALRRHDSRGPVPLPGAEHGLHGNETMESRRWLHEIPGAELDLHSNETMGSSRRLHEESAEDCDSMLDVAKNLREHDKGLLAAAYGLAFMTFLLIVVGVSFFFGRHMKPKPPGYWTARRSPVRPLSWFRDDYRQEIDVTAELGPMLQELFDDTTLSDYMGLGRDGNWCKHKALKVVKVTRIEDGKLWTRYQQMKSRITPSSHVLPMMSRSLVEKTRDGLAIVKAVSDEVSHYLGNFLKLDRYRGEVILFHGSPGSGARDVLGKVMYESDSTSPVGVIKRQGFDDRLGSVAGMYGSGTYFADKASKADCYAGRYNEFGEGYTSVGEEATMFLSRVVMGTPYVTNQSLEQLRRPPCVQGHFDLNLTFNQNVKYGKPWKEKEGVDFKMCEHARFDSVIGDFQVDGLTKLYREYVVYDKQCYPEFCVRYKRKKTKGGSSTTLPSEARRNSKSRKSMSSS